MPPRQVWLFQLGCWTALVTAAVHLFGHVIVLGDGSAAAGAGGDRLPSYLFLVPGQAVPSFDRVSDGFSLAFALLMTTMAAAGLAVQRRGREDALLMRGVARAYALGFGALLVISVLSFFSVQSFFIAATALCFALAAVSEG